MKTQNLNLKSQNLKKRIPPIPSPFETLKPQKPIEEPPMASPIGFSSEENNQAQKLAEMKKADEEKKSAVSQKNY